MRDSDSILQRVPVSARWLSYVGVWLLVALFSASQTIVTYRATGGPVDPPLVVKLTLLGWAIWAMLAPGVFVLARRWDLRSGRRGLRVVGHLLASGLGALIATGLYLVLRNIVGLPSPRSYPVQLLQSVHTNVTVYWAVVGAAHAYDYYRANIQRRAEAAELRESLSRAQLDALRAQLHPHLLFNALNSVSSLIHDDPVAAEDMLVQVSELLRRVITNPDGAEVTVAEEVEFLERYLSIEKIRFGERLTSTIEVSDDVLNALVPPLLLQPLAENAVKHAIGTRPSGGTISVTIAGNNGNLSISVADDGPGIEDSDRNRDGHGIGLANTMKRLETMYGDSHRLELVHSNDGGLEVNITLPLRWKRVD